MKEKEKLSIILKYWDFMDYFPNNKWYIFIHENNKNEKLINICKNRNYEDYEIYIKDEYSKNRYFKILLTDKFYIKDYYWSINVNEILKEWNDNLKKYNMDIYDVFYFNVIGFSIFD